MSEISNKVCHYYLQHFAQLPKEKQFHFAARLYLWSQDDVAAPLLKELRADFTAQGNPIDALATAIEHGRADPYRGVSRATLDQRRRFFDAYPLLRPASSGLLRVTFLLSVYGIDIRDELYRFFPRQELMDLRKRLLDDSAALTVLSTYAIADFLYLFDRVMLEDDGSLPVERFLEIGSSYRLDHDIDLQLYLYFLTHCVIGDSIFYWRRPPAQYVPTYRNMLQAAEQAIAERFDHVKLDNKFEFLVACKLCDYDSTLARRINDEAAASLSSAGDFLVDRHNAFARSSNDTFEGSEHRNVLFVLAQREFRPLA